MCTFVIFHDVPIVQMRIPSAEALVDNYTDTATKTGDAVSSLSTLMAEANELLEQSSHPLHGPMPALNTVAIDLRTDGRDLAWRVDWMKSTDAQPLGVSGQVQAYAPTTGGPNGTFDLDAALAASGLTEEEAARAKQAILGGADFSDTITAEKARTRNDNMAMFRQMEAQAWTTGNADHPQGDAPPESDGDRSLFDVAAGLWDKVPTKEFALSAVALLLSNRSRAEHDEPEDRGFLGDFKHNILDGNSVVGGLITGRPSPQAVAKIIENAPDVAQTLDNAATEIRSLNPASAEGAALLLSDPGQFVDNHINFLGGAKDWTVDTAKVAAAVTIASDPALNAEFERRTGRNIRAEISESLQSTVLFAADDPDAFASVVIDWQGLEDDPIRWAGNQAPEVLIEVLTAGSASGAIGARRGANVVVDVVDAVDDIPPPRVPPPPGVPNESTKVVTTASKSGEPGNHDEAITAARSEGVGSDSAIHMLDGEINRRNRAVGGHDPNSANIRILRQWVDEDTGLDTARIEVFDADSGQWIEKTSDTTLFPADWTPGQILRETKSAFGNSTNIGGNKWLGQSDSGQWITGYYRNAGSPGPGWSTAYPTGGPR